MAFFAQSAILVQASESCQIFDRKTANTPSAIQAYFSRSGNVYVEVCRSPPNDLGVAKVNAFGASEILLERNVCVFTSYPLDLDRWGSTNASLRQIANEGTRMMMIRQKDGCHKPFSDTYAATYGVSATRYDKIIRTWRQSLISEEEFDNTYRGIARRVASESDIGALRRLVVTGASKKLRPFTISRTWHLGIVNRYEITVLDPIHSGQVYVFTITEWAGRFYAVSGFGVGYTVEAPPT